MKLILEQIEWFMSHSEESVRQLPIETLNSFMRTLKLQTCNELFLKSFLQTYQIEERKKFGRLLLDIECNIEKKSVEDFINGKTAMIDEKLNRCTPHMLRETRCMNITPTSHILLVGAGAMPISAVILQRQFECKVTCLDIDNHAILLAKKWLQTLDMNASIQFVQEDIFRIANFDAYSHIIITGHILEKDRLLDHLTSFITQQFVLLRNSIGLYQHIYDCAMLFKSYEIIDLVDHNGNMPYMSVILKYIAADYSKRTPYYYFNLSTINRSYARIQRLLQDCDTIYYALKANGDAGIIEYMKKRSIPFEVSSIDELHVVENAAEGKADIICSLPVKSEELIVTLYQSGCRYFVFDNWNEYTKLQIFAPEAQKIVRIDITDISKNTIDYGMKVDTFLNEYQKGHMRVDGVTFYNIPNLSTLTLTQILRRCEMILHVLTTRPRVLNIGGNYRFETDLELGFYEELHRNLVSIKANVEDLIIYAEPGRTVVKSAGMIFTRVISIDRSKQPHEVFIDAGIPSGLLYSPKGIGLYSVTRVLYPSATSYQFYATTCSKKVLFSAMLPFTLKENDILVLEEMGTYSLCKANHFHGWALPQILYHSEEN